ncbi:MAG: hypoxanthine phosphoribosyltransferase [Thermoanaerobacterales bacterium]|nr:hypoxanthine phosphoribosyltransferase [Bacillota bacterium]MDI6906088.1 hypoxanthine phosphoribosyltransferase [Thermoanaerobacterales bacterium]
MTHPHVERVLVPASAIARRVDELGAQIMADYQGRELLVVGILKGSTIFLADLVRAVDLTVALDFVAISSYGHSTTSSGVVRILKDLEESIEGRHVLIVEDIVDTGLTLNYLRENLLARKPASLRICALLDKPSRRKASVPLDYLGFTIPDEFVVGYGLDYGEHYRNLRDVCVLKPEIYKS